MNTEPAPELQRYVEQITTAWREGDVDKVLSFMSSDANVSMGGPIGAVPDARGHDAVTALVRQLVYPLPTGAGVFPRKTLGFKCGEFAWATTDGVLRMPGRSDIGWSMVLILRRESGAWKFLHFGAFQGPAME